MIEQQIYQYIVEYANNHSPRLRPVLYPDHMFLDVPRNKEYGVYIALRNTNIIIIYRSGPYGPLSGHGQVCVKINLQEPDSIDKMIKAINTAILETEKYTQSFKVTSNP